MILDEVLQESTYDTDSMVDMFVEGFLYALEMQENGEKASSMEYLSGKLSEAANVAISELSNELKAHAAEKAGDKSNEFSKEAGKYAKKALNSDNEDERKKYSIRAGICNNIARHYDRQRIRIKHKLEKD